MTSGACRSSLLATTVVLSMSACGGAGSNSSATASGQRRTDGPPLNASAAGEVRTVPWPADQCTWIPVAAVESIMGPLAGPARHADGGCLYPLPEDTSPEAVRRRELARKLEEQAAAMARRLGTPTQTLPKGRPAEPAVIVQVSIGTTQSERGLKAGEKVLARWAGAEPGSDGRAKAAPPDGWDYAKSPIAVGLPGFLGRVGQLTITVLAQDLRVPATRLSALAASVRNRIPDLPFGSAGGGHEVASPAGPDPCSLLTPSEAAEVLGPLVVPPYRMRDESPFPDAGGASCAYRTAGHRVLALTPQWVEGRSLLEAARTVGGLVSNVMPDEAPEAADTLEGPWDESVSETATGDIVFLAGDRALEVSYGTSSTDASGAVRLARIAVGRLAKASPR